MENQEAMEIFEEELENVAGGSIWWIFQQMKDKKNNNSSNSENSICAGCSAEKHPKSIRRPYRQEAGHLAGFLFLEVKRTESFASAALIALRGESRSFSEMH